MPRKLIIYLLLITLPVPIVGCWDRRELNDIAINIGTGIDLTEDGKFKATAELIIPAQFDPSRGTSSGDKGFITVSAAGDNLSLTNMELQNKLPRFRFSGHRRIVIIGEHLAREKMEYVLDSLTRDPKVRLNTDLLIAKETTAENILNVTSKLEKVPAIAALKIRQISTPITTTLIELLITASGGENNVTLPVIEIVDQGKNVQIAGRAIFDQELKMIGHLDTVPSLYRLWLLSQLNSMSISAKLPDHKGEVTFGGTSLKAKIHPNVQQGKVSFSIELKATGTIIANNSTLDLRSPASIAQVESELEKLTQQEVERLISSVQENYGADIFGLGEAVHRKEPYYWKQVKKNWNQEFRHAAISVTSDIKIVEIGLGGPPLYMKAGVYNK